MKYVIDSNRIPEYKDALQTEVRNALETAGRETVGRIDRGFESGTDALGNPWEPLAPSTIRRKGHSDILIESGDLRESFRWSITGTPGDSADYELAIGSADPKLPFHEFGTESIPKRPVLVPAARYLEIEALPTHMSKALVNAERRSGVDGSGL